MRCTVTVGLTLAILGQASLAWEEPASRPSPAVAREVATGPVFATFRSQLPLVDREHVTVLGNRDDAREQTYVLEGRGIEVGAGKRSGRYCEPGMQRAGCPRCISPHAKPSTDCHHTIGYVGGGTPFRLSGERRAANEGTVGMDYSGWLFQRKTWLLWSHGGLQQGGEGRYEAEGPRIIPEK
ncbi:MAG: hypothetical protein ACK57G_11655 [Planctomycetota bacterium]